MKGQDEKEARPGRLVASAAERRLARGKKTPPVILNESGKASIAHLTRRGRELYEKIGKTDPARPLAERRALAERIDSWERSRAEVLEALPQRLLDADGLVLGALDPLVETLIASSLEPGERSLLVVAGIGGEALALTESRLIVLVAPARGLSGIARGAGGAALGGFAGQKLGGGLGTAAGFLGDALGIPNVGHAIGALGPATGMIAGGVLGYGLAYREVKDVLPVSLPLSSITDVAAGFRLTRTAGGDARLPSITISSTAHDERLELVYSKEDAALGAFVVPFLRNAARARREAPAVEPANAPPALPGPAQGTREEALVLLKQLGELRAAGVVTDEELQAKKKELLARL